MSSSSTTVPHPDIKPPNVHGHDSLPKRPLTKVPIWIPVSAFIGTSLALAIPLLMLRKQRTVLRLALKEHRAPPPRRVAGGSSVVAPFRGTSSSTTSAVSTETSLLSSSESDSASPGIGEMMSALSKMNASSAMMAAKAFAIATGLVAVGGVALTWAVKSALGVQNAREFGHKMRLYLWSSLPSLPQRILRPAESEDERHDFHAVAPFGSHEQWNWEDAEKRLDRAYEEGGIGLWAQVALREVEAEARVEREKREKEIRAELELES